MISMKVAKAIFDSSSEIRSEVAMELTASYPIPAFDDSDAYLRAFYYARFGPPPAEVDDLYPPRWIATISADDGKLIELVQKPPRFFGIDGDPDRPFAQHVFTHDWIGNALQEKLDLMLRIYDDLIREWLLSRPVIFSTSDSEAKTSFRDLFNQLSPPPLLPCYLKLGDSFFEWVGYRMDRR